MWWLRWERDMRLEWAPHVIPCVAMLYLMRNSGEPTSGGSEEARHHDEKTELGGGEASGGHGSYGSGPG